MHEQNSEQLRAAHLRQQALDMRMAGVGYREIAETLGVPELSVWKMIGVELQANHIGSQDLRSRCRDEQLQRLDIALRAIWPKVEAGELEAIDCLLRLEARRTKLLGLDADAMPEGGERSTGRLRSARERVPR